MNTHTTNTQNTQPTKVYVKVATVFNEDGLMLPRYLVWEDGVKYKIDRVGMIRPAAASRGGGQGDRYTIYIGGKQSYLFFERNFLDDDIILGRWFVERREAG